MNISNSSYDNIWISSIFYYFNKIQSYSQVTNTFYNCLNTCQINLLYYYKNIYILSYYSNTILKNDKVSLEFILWKIIVSYDIYIDVFSWNYKILFL